MTDPGFAAYGLDGDFTAAYLAARRLADLAERDPGALCPACLAALERLLVADPHARRTQARILYRDAAEAQQLKVHYSWPVPRIWSPLAAFTFLPALQLISYAFSVGLGQDVDQPRNLAKSVTVE